MRIYIIIQSLLLSITMIFEICEGFPQIRLKRQQRQIWSNFENGAGDLFIFDYAESVGGSSSPKPPPPTRRRPSRRTTVAVPGMGTTRTACEDNCLTTNQYNPVCGMDDVTYFNRGRLQCARKCGKNVTIKNVGACSLQRQ